MRLAISNIAWDVNEDGLIAELLQRYHIDAIDIAPSKYFPIPAQASERDINQVKEWWAANGIELTGMQSLLFGTRGLNVFGAPAIQDELLQHLTGICRIGAGLCATRLVFGSPKNRDCSGLLPSEATDQALQFFSRLGDIAHSYGVIICLEPNPICYGANFLTNTAETAQFVADLQHPAVKMQFDTGALTINHEDVEQTLIQCAPLIGHIHISEPDLLPIGDNGSDHQLIYQALVPSVPDLLVTIEMLATKNEPHLASIERALNFTSGIYRPNQESI